MADERLREAERRWRETGSSEDLATYQRERSRSGLPQLVVCIRLSTRFRGARTPPDGSELLDRILTDACARSHNVILDASETRPLASTQIGLLVRHADALKANGGSLVLCAINSRLRLVFDMLGLKAFFAYDPTVATALETRSWELLETVEVAIEVDD